MSGSIQGPPVPVVAGTTAAQQMILTRFNDSLENVRREFDLFGQEVGVLRGQRDDFENKGEHAFVSWLLILLFAFDPGSLAKLCGGSGYYGSTEVEEIVMVLAPCSWGCLLTLSGVLMSETGFTTETPTKHRTLLSTSFTDPSVPSQLCAGDHFWCPRSVQTPRFSEYPRFLSTPYH